MFTSRTKWAILKALFKKKKSPYYIQYYINGRCNLKCKQCNIVETNSRIEELGLSEIDNVARNIAKIGGGIVLLTGGEPFLRKDLPEIVGIFSKYGLNVRLQTAGIATTDELQRCYDNGARDINISLDSLDSNKQDYINSVPNSWHNAVDAIERSSKIFKESSAICSLGCVISRHNFREIPALIEFASKIGWYISLVPVHIATMEDPKGFRSYDKEFCFSEEDYEELRLVFDQIVKMKEQGHLVFDSIDYLKSSFNFLKTGKVLWRKNGVCDSPDLYFAVRPNGEFAPCCDFNLDGELNLKNSDFHKDYEKGLAHEKTKDIVNSCSGCHYGSYPEVTLSVRNIKTFYERVKISLFSQKQKIQYHGEGHFFKLIEEIREKHGLSKIPMHPDVKINKKLEDWKNIQKRIALIKEDNQTRIRENRKR